MVDERQIRANDAIAVGLLLMQLLEFLCACWSSIPVSGKDFLSRINFIPLYCEKKEDTMFICASREYR
jgi:hypothetical protein